MLSQVNMVIFMLLSFELMLSVTLPMLRLQLMVYALIRLVFRILSVVCGCVVVDNIHIFVMPMLLLFLLMVLMLIVLLLLIMLRLVLIVLPILFSLLLLCLIFVCCCCYYMVYWLCCCRDRCCFCQACRVVMLLLSRVSLSVSTIMMLLL